MENGIKFVYSEYYKNQGHSSKRRRTQQQLNSQQQQQSLKNEKEQQQEARPTSHDAQQPSGRIRHYSQHRPARFFVKVYTNVGNFGPIFSLLLPDNTYRVTH